MPGLEMDLEAFHCLPLTLAYNEANLLLSVVHFDLL